MNLKKVTYLLIPPALALLLLIGWGMVSGVARAAEGPREGSVLTELAPRQVGAPSGINAPAQVCTPDTPDMVSYWPMDDGPSATVFTDVVGVNDGTCADGRCPDSVPGLVGTAFDFTGNDGISITPTVGVDFVNADGFSFELWVNTTQDCTAGSQSRKVYLGKYGGSTGASWWLGCGEVADQAVFQVKDDDGAAFVITGTTSITDSVFHHLVGVRDNVAAEIRLYVDGVEEASAAATYTGDFANPLEMNMGVYNVNQYRMDGILDEVAIYSRALTEAEILAHYNGGAGQSYCTGNAPPVLTNPGDQSSAEGESVSLQIEASDADMDPLTYEADGLPPDLTIDPTSGLIGGGIAAGAASGSPYTVVITVTDNSASSDVETFAWTVTEPGANQPPDVTNPGDQNSAEGQTVNLQIEATDPDLDPLTYEASGLPANLTINPTSGLISGGIASGAASGSPYTVVVTATDTGALSDSETFTWAVGEPNNPPLVDPVDDQANMEGDTVSLQIVATDPDGDTPLSYSAVGLPDGLSIDSATGLIDGYLADGSAGSYSVEVTVSDGKPGGDTLVSFDWEVTDKWFAYMPIIFRND